MESFDDLQIELIDRSRSLRYSEPILMISLSNTAKFYRENVFLMEIEAII